MNLPDDGLFVSPELVLVDPELAVRERARLPERMVDSRPVSAEVASPGSTHDKPVRAADAPRVTGVAEDRPRSRTQSWRLPTGVAAAIVIGLVLLDVRVEVGRSPAAAETSSRPPATAPALAPAPAPAPASPSLPLSSDPSPQPELRRFAWAPVKGASGYRVEIHRGSSRVFVRETRKPEVAVPRTWRLDGRTHRLRPGEYRWYVWPIVSGRRAARAVVQASLSIPAA